MDSFLIKVDGKEISVRAGQSILEAALENGIFIPHLCHHKDLPDIGGCGMCVVELDGKTVRSCSTPVAPGMSVVSRNEHLDHVRMIAMQLMLAGHIDDCNSCPKYLKCEFQMIIQQQGATVGSLRRTARDFECDEHNPLIIRDMDRCISCGRCVRACKELRGVGALRYAQDEKGRRYVTTVAEGEELKGSDCRFCGACVEVCPTGALRDKDGVFAERFCRGDMLVPCEYECPAHLDIPAYIRAINNNDEDEAMALIMERAPLPRSLSWVCMRFCEERCRRQYLDEPVSICSLKRYAADSADGGWKANLKIAADTGKSVAIVGAGPAGLTTAWLLRLRGHKVKIFEKHSEAGGMLRWGLPEYRLPLEELQKDIRCIEETGVEIVLSHPIEDRAELSGFDAVLWCAGATKSAVLPLEGADSEGVHTALDFLCSLRSGERPELGERVLVLGGGDVAYDCARSALRLGAEAALCCLENEASMPATQRERSEGAEEGVQLYPGRSFIRIVTENGRVCGVECAMVESFSFDEQGRLQTELVPGSEHIIPCDSLIFAVGQKPVVPGGIGLELTERGLVSVDKSCAASAEGWFAAGDAAGGTSSVVQTVAWGQKAAAAIDEYLGGDGEVIPTIAAHKQRPIALGSRENFELSRVDAHHLPAEERKCSFGPCELQLMAAEALGQAGRCLQCDLRREISRPRFYSEFAFRKEGGK